MRTGQHMSISHRTGRHLSKPLNSAIRTHSEMEDQPLKFSNFCILDKCSNENDFRLLVFLYINKLKPSRNEQQDSTALHIVI